MSAMASQITGVTIVYPTVCSGENQSSASLAFVRGIHRWPVNSPHKGPVMWKRFPFNDVIMSEKVEHWADRYTRPHGWAKGCHNVKNYENIFAGPTYTMISSLTVISNFERLRGHRCSKPFTAVPGVKVTNVWNVKYFVDRKKYVSFTLMICASTHHILHHIWILISVKQV